MRRIVLVGLAVAVLGTSAHADTKKRSTAQLIAGIGTGVSGALIMTSFFTARFGEIDEPVFYTGLATSVFTPSLGHWYAKQWFTPGIAVRAGAGVLGIVAVATQYDPVLCPGTTTMATCHSLTPVGAGLLIVAGVAYIGGAAYDLRDVGDAVDRYNHDHAVFITPTAMRDATNTPVAGLALGGTF